LKRKVLILSVAALAAFTLTAQEKKEAAPKSAAGGILHPEMAVENGSYDKPMLFGHAEVDRGELLFEGRRYKVTRGTIDFTNPTRIDPFFDIEAETSVRVPYQTYRVTVRAAGTFDRLQQPSFESDPPLPAADVVALLFSATQRPTGAAELRALQNPNQTETDILTTRATLALASPLSEGVGKVVEQTFGVDTFQLTPTFIDPYSDTARVNPSARLTIGKRISDRAYLTFSRGSRKRLQALEDARCHAVIMSALGAAEACRPQDSIAYEFPSGTHASGHMVFERPRPTADASAPLRVALDRDSVDLQLMTELEFRGRPVEFVAATYMQFGDLFRSGRVDAAVWDVDDVTGDLPADVIRRPFSPSAEAMLAGANTRSTVVVRRDDSLTAAIVHQCLAGDRVLDVQRAVVAGERLPEY